MVKKYINQDTRLVEWISLCALLHNKNYEKNRTFYHIYLSLPQLGIKLINYRIVGDIIPSMKKYPFNSYSSTSGIWVVGNMEENHFKPVCKEI